MKAKKFILLKITIFLMLLLEIFSTIALVQAGNSSYAFFFIAIIIVSVLFIIQLISANENIHKFIAEVNSDIQMTEKEGLYSFPVASMIVDEENKIIWCNKCFSENIMNEEEIFGNNINNLFDIDFSEFSRKSSVSAEFNGHTYMITRETSCKPLSLFCFQDITDYHKLQEKYKNTRQSVIIITVDNYEDLLQNSKESDKAHILGDIEKLFEEFISETNGFIKKISNNTFIAVIEQQFLSKIIEERFKILDNARKIKIDERINLTLSIGVGYDCDSLAESEIFAKQALDMALGRGGDQAAVKSDAGFQFYGGVSKGIEKQSRTKTRIIANALQELIHNSSEILIMGHRFGDLDSIGAASGLADTITDMGKSVKIVVDPVKNLALPIINRITEFGDGEIFIDEQTALGIIRDTTLLIVVDTHNKSLLESPALYEKAKQVVVIDHHRKNINFIDNAVIFHNEPYASSTCEIVTEIIQYFQNIGKLQPHYADALFSGITLDTKNFVMKTGVRTFEAAAFLRKCGADTVAVKSMFSSSMEAYQQRSALVSSAEIYNSCAIAVSEDNAANMRVIAPQASDELLNITGVDASFVIYKSGNDMCISARSLGAVNVQIIMEKLGGGGHQTMAATQLSGKSAEEAKQMLTAAIDEYTADSNSQQI